MRKVRGYKCTGPLSEFIYDDVEKDNSCWLTVAVNMAKKSQTYKLRPAFPQEDEASVQQTRNALPGPGLYKSFFFLSVFHIVYSMRLFSDSQLFSKGFTEVTNQAPPSAERKCAL